MFISMVLNKTNATGLAYTKQGTWADIDSPPIDGFKLFNDPLTACVVADEYINNDPRYVSLPAMIKE